MKINLHYYCCTIQRLTPDHIPKLLDVIGIELPHCNDYATDHNRTITYSLWASERTVQLHLPTYSNEYRQCKLTINGAFFEFSEGFNLFALLDFFVDEHLTFKNKGLDVAFDDTHNILTDKVLLKLFSEKSFRKYCTGTFTRPIRKKNQHEIVDSIRPKLRSDLSVERIEFWIPSNSVNYATLYRRPADCWRLELKLRNDDDISCMFSAATLPMQLGEFEETAIGILARHISVYTSASLSKYRKSHRKSDLVVHPLWAQFLQVTELRPLSRISSKPNFSVFHEARTAAQLQRLAAQVVNISNRDNTTIAVTLEQLKNLISHKYNILGEIK